MRLAVEEVLEEIGAGESPRVLVLNKVDLLDEQARQVLCLRHPEAVLVSAETGAGLEALRARIERELRHTLCPVELLVPYANGEASPSCTRWPGDLRSDTPEVRVRALVPARMASRFERFVVA